MNRRPNLLAAITLTAAAALTRAAEEQPLPNGEFGAEQDVIVQEIQAINR
ncbi:hypothetical protein [Streptomyces sp. NBC_00286]|nr:hypothetical protein [Streptomyces sp. NBC_00286]